MLTLNKISDAYKKLKVASDLLSERYIKALEIISKINHEYEKINSK